MKLIEANLDAWLFSLLSGFVGAIVGALVYGWVALRGIREQISATARLQQIGSLDECTATLRALVAELAHNRIQLAETYAGYRALALMTVMWQTFAAKLGPVSVDTLKKVSLAYAYVSVIRTTEEAIRSDLEARRTPEGYQFIQKAWADGLSHVDEALAAIGEQVSALEQRKAHLTRSFAA